MPVIPRSAAPASARWARPKAHRDQDQAADLEDEERLSSQLSRIDADRIEPIKGRRKERPAGQRAAGAHRTMPWSELPGQDEPSTWEPRTENRELTRPSRSSSACAICTRSR